jgi:CheY-like chemotaxis protein
MAHPDLRMLPKKDVMTEPANQKHILAMNESDDVLKLFRELLEDEGYRVTTQPYLDKDLGRIEAAEPDLILLDYM